MIEGKNIQISTRYSLKGYWCGFRCQAALIFVCIFDCARYISGTSNTTQMFLNIATKKVITTLLSTMLLPNHLDGVTGLQRMVRRGRSSPSSLISFSYCPLTTLGAVPILQKLQPFMEAAVQSAVVGSRASSFHFQGRRPCLTPQRSLLCSLLGTPSPRLVAHVALCCAPVCFEERRAAFSVGSREDAQPSPSFEQVKSSERGMDMAGWAQVSS